MPIAPFALALVHASLVVAATLIARACIPCRFAAGRATVGAVGMACVLAVTLLTFFPMPNVWPEAGAILETPDDSSRPAGAGHAQATGPTPRASDSDAMSLDPQPALAAEMPAPLQWLRRLGSRLERVTVAANASPRVWRWPLLAFLLGGSAVGLVRLLLSMRSLASLRKSASPIVDVSIHQIVERTKQRCGCHQKIFLCQSDRLASAATCGWWRPVILLPADWRHWSAEELAAAIAHEVAHVHRADYVQRLVALFGVAIHFFHPLVRVAARRLVIDQEFAADRLARGLADDPGAYMRGLARLALRYHESLSGKPAWPSVSAMPRSSDFLARRLEMLRVKNRPTSNYAAKLIAYGTSSCLLAVALATSLLRGATAADEEPPVDTSRPVAETARVEPKKLTPENVQRPAETDLQLFNRQGFDPAMIRRGNRGGFLFRLGEILRHPALELYADDMKAKMSAGLCAMLDMPPGTLDASEIEWIAGTLHALTKPAKPGGQSIFMFGSQEIVIRMNHAADWQESVLKNAAGATLQTHEGKNYVQLPVWPSLGGAVPRLRFPNDTTIIAYADAPYDAEGEAKALQRFFDDTPGNYVWASTWRGADAGLITLLFDNQKVGWLDLKHEKEGWPEGVWPLVEKPTYFALGIDWNNAGSQAGLKLRGACPDSESAEQVRRSMLAALSVYNEHYKTDKDISEPVRALIGQFISAAKVEISDPESTEQFVDTAGSFDLTAPVLMDWIPWEEPIQARAK